MQTFKCGFDIKDYEDIIPPYPSTKEELAKVININKDNPLDQYWEKPKYPNILTPDYIYNLVLQTKRGTWILIKGMYIWLPPNYFQFLQFGNASGAPPQFRLKRLKNVYEKLRIRMDARSLGSYNIKNRQDGDTTMCMSDSLWEVHGGDMEIGSIWVQSKTRNDAINPCWFSMQTQWNAYPMLLKDSVYPHFISGDNIAETLKFQVKADPFNPNDLGKNIVIGYGPSVYNAFDGKTNVRKIILDEVNKWDLCSLLKTVANYKKFLMPGRERKGVYDMISSPADKAGIHNDEAYRLWTNSNPANINPETGSTYSRIKRLYSNPLDGIDSFYDIYGDADPQEIFEHIHRERRSKAKDELMEEIRGYPLPIKGTNEPDEEEIFGATDTHSIFINMKGMKEQKNIILKEKEKRVEYGIWEWPQNIPYSGEPIWKCADTMQFNDYDARWVRTITNEPALELKDIRIPPDLGSVMTCLGVDPYNLRFAAKNKKAESLGAAVAHKFRDLNDTGIIECPIAAYLARPSHQETMFDDMIKGAIAMRAMVEYENTNDKLENWFEDKGFIAWMLPSANAKVQIIDGEAKLRRGDAPSGRTAIAHINEGVNLINGITNTPILPTDPYWLKQWNIEEIFADFEMFDKQDTQKSHLTMAYIRALMGKNKIKFGKKNKPDAINNAIIEGLYD